MGLVVSLAAERGWKGDAEPCSFLQAADSLRADELVGLEIETSPEVTARWIKVSYV